jgi:hypothetical protein
MMKTSYELFQIAEQAASELPHNKAVYFGHADRGLIFRVFPKSRLEIFQGEWKPADAGALEVEEDIELSECIRCGVVTDHHSTSWNELCENCFGD